MWWRPALNNASVSISLTSPKRRFWLDVWAKRWSECDSRVGSTGATPSPAVPLLGQSVAAIERSRAIVLLISRHAMRSADLRREIEHAHKVGCAMVPLLIEMSREEFEKLAPSWRRILGEASLLELRRNEPLEGAVRRLTASAASLGIVGDFSPHVEPPTRTAHSIAGQIWATDANQIDIHDLDRILFRNDAIDDFLQRKHRHFVSATKGFGKTLLLTCKRRILTRGNDSGHQEMTLVPEGRPFLDFMSEMRSLSANYEKPLADLSTTKRLWSAAFRISAVSHHPGVMQDRDAEELQAFPPRMRNWLQGMRIQPTVVFKEATSLRVSELNQLIDRTENFLDQKMRQIHGATYFFIDKVDQAIRHLSRDAWIAVQAGLIEAAWETMNANSHLKIYASIRQEAFSNYQSDIKSNLFAATTNLDYSEEELHALLDQLANCYEGCRSFADFLGSNVIRHGRRPAPEDSFQYVRRHTCGRPRDLVAIASEISCKRSGLSEKRLREIVHRTSSMVVASNVFDEVQVFLNCLSDTDARLRFLAAIPSNILEKHEAVQVCEQFNGLEPGVLQHFGEDSIDIFHPFRDLYFAGMLGVVEYDSETGLTQQRFRRPHDSLVYAADDLPESSVFLIHPALDLYIRGQRTRTPFLQFQHIPVGEQLAWESHYPTLMQIEKTLRRVADHAFVDLCIRSSSEDNRYWRPPNPRTRAWKWRHATNGGRSVSAGRMTRAAKCCCGWRSSCSSCKRTSCGRMYPSQTGRTQISPGCSVPAGMVAGGEQRSTGTCHMPRRGVLADYYLPAGSPASAGSMAFQVKTASTSLAATSGWSSPTLRVSEMSSVRS